MNKTKPETKKKLSKQDKEVTKTLFILMLPTIIVAAVGVNYVGPKIGIGLIALVIYQWVILKQFAERFHGGF